MMECDPFEHGAIWEKDYLKRCLMVIFRESENPRLGGALQTSVHHHTAASELPRHGIPRHGIPSSTPSLLPQASSAGKSAVTLLSWTNLHTIVLLIDAPWLGSLPEITCAFVIVLLSDLPSKQILWKQGLCLAVHLSAWWAPRNIW